MGQYLLKNAVLVNEGLSFNGGIFVSGGMIADVFDYSKADDCAREEAVSDAEVIDLGGCHLCPGVIDTHVHFREPGATQKGCIASESAAAVAGGVTSYLDMPNNNPPAVTAADLAAKMEIAARGSRANYGFYLGATDYNIEEVARAGASGACAVKVFMGSSTGNLLVSDPDAMRSLFERSPLMIAVHAEDNAIIAANLDCYKALFGDDIPFSAHPAIRSAAACITATHKAVELALSTGARLHIMHVSTAEEVDYLAEVMHRTDKITAETCVQYLTFCDEDYERYGSQIKCNPAIKGSSDRDALIRGVRSGVLQTISTDHAPHLPQEKAGGYLQSASGIPLVQYSLLMMLEKVREGVFTLPMVVEKMCHAPARLFAIERRGYIRKGYFADLVVFDMHKPSDVAPLSRCGWSPQTEFSSTIEYTFVNGVIVARSGILTDAQTSGRKLTFAR
ncbi:MAG: dihydroorotase [Bacteroidales bacterium]|nr:dihydroorotase [Bacteroidales bacterium]